MQELACGKFGFNYNNVLTKIYLDVGIYTVEFIHNKKKERLGTSC